VPSGSEVDQGVWLEDRPNQFGFKAKGIEVNSIRCHLSRKRKLAPVPSRSNLVAQVDINRLPKQTGPTAPGVTVWLAAQLCPAFVIC